MATKEQNIATRREHIVESTLEAIVQHGIGSITHRKIAACAAVPLGSLTYYFSTLDALLEEAFTRFTLTMSEQYQASFIGVKNSHQACDAIADLIAGEQVMTERNRALMYQLYAFIHRRSELAGVMQRWMFRSQQTLEKWFDATTARGLDAFIEGMTLHVVMDTAPLDRAQIRAIVGRIAGEK